MGAPELENLVRSGQFEAALAAARVRLETESNDQQALYIAAVASRYGGWPQESLKYSELLVHTHPGFARGWQERGHALRAQGRQLEALAAFRYATAGNHALLASWRAVSELSNDPDEVSQAREEVVYLSAMPPELLSVASMIYESRLSEAEMLCRRFMKANPRHVEGMRLLADVGTRLSVYDDAEALLSAALTLKPDFHLARLDYINVLQRRQRFPEAMAQAEILLAIDPTNRFFRMVAASQAAGLGDFNRAIDMFDSLIADGKGTALTHLMKAHALKTIGRQDEAIAAYRAAAEKRPDFGDAYWSLANLKTYEFSPEELRHMEQCASRTELSSEDRIHFAFALGKAYEDEGSYEKSFKHYYSGNTLKRQTLTYDPGQLEDEVKALKSLITPEFIKEKKRYGHKDCSPIFIVGLPRAGSTLIEQILASHSQVEGTLELPYMPAAVHRLRNRGIPYPGVFSQLVPGEYERIGKRYLQESEAFRSGLPRFVDKMPNNFRNIALIATALPNAFIIDARRNAMDCSFSCFKQLFAEGQEFTYSLEHIARYYHSYVELMDHWEQVMPGRILRVQHEELLKNLEPEVRRILHHCGLEFETTCLEYYNSSRPVRTASSEQVRQPINLRGLGKWRKFSPWLAPLSQSLGALAEQ